MFKIILSFQANNVAHGYLCCYILGIVFKFYIYKATKRDTKKIDNILTYCDK